MSLVNSPGLKVKTPSVQALGVLLFGLYCFSTSALAADCMPAGAGEVAVVDRIYDGDTIKLKDGRHVRILGMNAPEVDHGKVKTGQALGEESRRAAEAFFKANKTVRLFYDEQRVDRYERTLAHVYDTQDNSLAATLLRSGLGFHVAIPPNLSLNECLGSQEAIARKKGLGVWSHQGWKAKAASLLTMEDTGFQRIRGRVMSVRKAQSIWLELDGPLVIKITPTDLKNFHGVNWSSWKGKDIEVRGWVTERGGSDESERKDKPEPMNNKFSARKSYKSLIVQPRIKGNLELVSP